MDTTGTVIGLDQALVNTGYVVMTTRGRIITKGVILTSYKTEYHKRLIHIESEVQKLINRYKPDLIYLEEVYSSRTTSSLKLRDVKIVLEMLFCRLNINFTVMSATLKAKNSWRSHVGLTNSKKEFWCNQIKETNEHIADAIGIAKGGISYTKSIKCHIDTHPL